MHLDLLTAQHRRAGRSPAEARRLARAKFGGVTQLKESLRDQAGFPLLESILHDVRYAARSLVRQPGVTALTAGILALGLGLNAAVLAVAYGVLWRPLPYPAADRLVTVARVNRENGSEAGFGGGCLAMAAGGLVLGLAAAWAGLRLFAAGAAGVMPRVGAVALDPPVVLAGLVLTLLVGLACGGASVAGAVTPRRAGAVRGDAAALRGGAAGTGSRAAGRLRAGLVAGQIALSIVLLSGAGLLVRTVDRLLDEDAGFDPRRALTARLMLADTSFIEDGAQAQTAFVDSLLERVRGLPGVQAAGVGSVLPPDDDPVSVEFVYEDDRGAASRREIILSFGAVTRGYFAALGGRLRDGRRFDAGHNLAEVSPVMLSETAARFIHPNRDPIGRPMWYGDIDALDITRESPVIAVVDDMKYAGLAAPRGGSIYVPWARVPTGVSHLVVRTTGDPMALAPAVRDLIRTLNPSLPAPDVRSLEDHVAGSIAERRLRALPAAGFAALALAVAMVGLFGALARAVVERRQELAVRAAVGASPGRLVRLVLRSAVAVTGVGLAVGLPAAAATGRGLASLLYGVGPYDPATFAAVAGVVVLTALAASAIPARRAARLDPMVALRAE